MLQVTSLNFFYQRREGNCSLKYYTRSDFLMQESKNINESDKSMRKVAESR